MILGWVPNWKPRACPPLIPLGPKHCFYTQYTQGAGRFICSAPKAAIDPKPPDANVCFWPATETHGEDALSKPGVSVKGFYYTVGRHDMVVIMEGTDEAVTTALLKVAH